MTGKIEISVTLFFETDLDEENIEDVLAEMDYMFNHKFISETRINGQID